MLFVKLHETMFEGHKGALSGLIRVSWESHEHGLSKWIIFGKIRHF